MSVALVGCSELSTGSYPRDLRFPLRTDLLVVKSSEKDEFRPISPGMLEQRIGRIDSLGGKTLNPADLKDVKDPDDLEGKKQDPRKGLTKALRECFGTPAQPWVVMGDHEDAWTVQEQSIRLLAGSQAKLAGELYRDEKKREDAVGLVMTELRKGSQLYRRHCLHCHGLPGDGRGPTGPWVNPFPRDYRQGQFKFVSNPSVGGKPSRADLKRTVTHGLDGTSMPSFALLKEEEIEHLVSYVAYLSLRGETEFITMRRLLDNTFDSDSVLADVQKQLKELMEKWTAANAFENQVPKPSWEGDEKKREQAVRRGYELMSTQAKDASTGKLGAPTANCLQCHQDFGRQSLYKPDVWGTLAKPVNFTSGVYRGGRRPIDHFYRIKFGIPPSGMAEGKYSDEDLWALVAFVQAAPYPGMLPRDVLDKLYPPSRENVVAGR